MTTGSATETQWPKSIHQQLAGSDKLGDHMQYSGRGAETVHGFLSALDDKQQWLLISS